MKFSWVSILLGFLTAGSFAAMEFKEAEITTIKNMVEHDPGTGAAPAKVSEKIQEKSKVSTAAASMAELTFADSSITRMGANTQFSFQSKERLVKLEQGSILVNTPPGKGGATVECGGVTGAVSGTTFMASRDTAGNVMFVMLEGSGTLKVTVPMPGGGVQQKEIRPGQAASVGTASISKEADAGGGAGGPPKPDAAGKTEGGGESPEPTKAPSIQVFEVDVKKVVETAPLIKEFKNELPSMEKIEKTIETQATAVREGKVEKLEVEVVAVKEDGDLLVGAPKVEKQEMTVVNKKQEVAGAGKGGPGDNLDIDTAAGPGAGDAQPTRPVAALPPPPAGAEARPAPGPGAVSGVIGQISNQIGLESTPTALDLKINGSTAVVTLNRAPTLGRPLILSGVAGLPTDLVIPAGRASVSFSLPAKNLFPGFVSATDPTLRAFSITATSLLLSFTASSADMFPAATLAASNPARDLMPEVGTTRVVLPTVSMATAYEIILGSKAPILIQAIPAGNQSYEAAGVYAAADVKIRAHTLTGGWQDKAPVSVVANSVEDDEPMLKALDAFFYFEAASPLAAGQPTPNQWFADLKTSRSLAAGFVADGKRGLPIDLGMSMQDFDFYAAGTFTARPSDQQPLVVGGADAFGILIPQVTHNKAILFASQFDLQSGTTTAAWTGLSGYDATTAPDPAKPLEVRWSGYFGQFSDFIEPAGLVWDDVTGALAGGVKLLTDPGLTGLELAAGKLGFQARGLDWVGNGSYGLALSSAGDLEMAASRISRVGSGGEAAESFSGLTIKAQGKVRLGGADAADQVRLEAEPRTATATSTAPNLAVIRTGDSLELRNLVIRSFDGTRLEKVTTAADGTQTVAGRVLVSGSSVRDFKIKELVGAAVNADAKIQMMAMADNGTLAGEMMVEGSLPVATKLASALAATGESLPAATASAQVHAEEINLAADRVNFNGANLAAMNSIAVRANTVLVQNSFMTVVRNSGMINMYVQQGLLNKNYGTVVAGQANFAGNNTFQIGSLPAIVINSQETLNAAYGTRLFDTQSPGVGGTPQVGSINVLKL